MSSKRGYIIYTYDGKNYGDSEDFYRFYLTSGAGKKIAFRMTPNPSANFNLSLYRPSGSNAGNSVNGTGALDQVTADINQTGWWYAKVYHVSGYGYYTFDVEEQQVPTAAYSSAAPTT